MISIRIPKPGPDFDNATITSWEKSEGDRIRVGDVIAIIKTSIGSFRVTAEEEGTLASIIQKAASTIDFENPIAMLAQDNKPVEASMEPEASSHPDKAEPPSTASETEPQSADEQSASTETSIPAEPGTPPPPSAESTAVQIGNPDQDADQPREEAPQPTQESKPEREKQAKSKHASSDKPHGVKVSPAARSLAEKFGVDLSIIKGTGEDGRILYIDVEDYLSSHPDAPEPVSVEKPQDSTPIEPEALPQPEESLQQATEPSDGQPEPPIENEESATPPAQEAKPEESVSQQTETIAEPESPEAATPAPESVGQTDSDEPVQEETEPPEQQTTEEAEAAGEPQTTVESYEPAQKAGGTDTEPTGGPSTSDTVTIESEMVSMPDNEASSEPAENATVSVFSDLAIEPPFTPKPPSEDVPWYAGRGLSEILSELLSTPISPNQGDVADLFFLSKDGDEVTIPFTTLKRSYADLQVESIHNKPRLHLFAEIDFSDALRWMAKYNEKNMVEVCATDMLMKVCGYVLTLMPEMNSHVQQDSLVLKRSINIGIVTSLDEGVVIPVVSNVGRLPFLQMVETVRKNLSMATKSKLVVDDDPTFTLFDLGAFGVSSFIPLILPPQSCCLAVGCLQKKVAVVNDALAIRNMIQVTLACDPRGIDGVTAARFLNKLKHEIESVRTDTDPDWLGGDPG
ncbi:MAG: 2-oxo acid dehydrogenase subunit E2, partial [Opitutales bacterium]|nr:2-oxo acid dehydrogenase subunit E2 [Opitutales bacterium]